MSMTKTASLARRLLFQALESFTGGGLEIISGDRTWGFGDRSCVALP